MLSVRILLLVVLVLASVDVWARRNGKRHHMRRKWFKRFPRPYSWMHYSSNYDPAVEENGCIDIRPECDKWALFPGYCGYAREYMIRHCKKSCKLCKQEDAAAIGRTSGVVIPNEVCEDRLEDCRTYVKSQSQCSLFSGLMKKYCARTCGFCCFDILTDCSLFIRRPSQCRRLNGFFRKYCPNTCQMCGFLVPLKKPAVAMVTGCQDELDDCKLFSLEQCQVHKSFCSKYCAKTCGFCGHSPEGSTQPFIHQQLTDQTIVKEITRETSLTAKNATEEPGEPQETLAAGTVTTPADSTLSSQTTKIPNKATSVSDSRKPETSTGSSAPPQTTELRTTSTVPTKAVKVPSTAFKTSISGNHTTNASIESTKPLKIRTQASEETTTAQAREKSTSSSETKSNSLEENSEVTRYSTGSQSTAITSLKQERTGLPTTKSSGSQNLSSTHTSSLEVSSTNGSKETTDTEEPKTSSTTDSSETTREPDTDQIDVISTPSTAKTGTVDSIPDTEAPTTIPDTEAPTTIPDTKAPTTIPDTKAPTTIPDTKAPTTIPDTKAPTTIPDTEAPTTIPDTEAPTTIPDIEAPTTLPDTDAPTTIPDTEAPTTIPDTEAPTTIPDTDAPTTIPDTEAPTTIPDTDAPTTIPVTDTNELTTTKQNTKNRSPTPLKTETTNTEDSNTVTENPDVQDSGFNHDTTTIVALNTKERDIDAAVPTATVPTTVRSNLRSKTKESGQTGKRAVCVDKLKECASYVNENINYCKYHVHFMHDYCSKSCGFCGKSAKVLPKCEDRRKKKCQYFSRYVGYCTVNRKYMKKMCPLSCGFCAVAPGSPPLDKTFVRTHQKYELAIRTKWDGTPIRHAPIKFQLSAEDNTNVRLEVSGPLFNQPGPPPCVAGQPCWQLWNYEVAEVFFLGEKEKYLELEVSPHGPHLLLLLDGVRKPFKTKLPMRYSATKDLNTMTWNGTAIIPIDYFPPGMRKINAYAIHGPDHKKSYESLYPAIKTAYPDFHRLEFFKDFDFKSMFPSGWNQPISPLWLRTK